MDETGSPPGPGAPDGDGSAVDPETAALALRLRSNLEYARKLYGETGNPLYAVWALSIVTDPRAPAVLGFDPGSGIPEWCLEWLHPSLVELWRIARRIQRRGERASDEAGKGRVLTAQEAAQRVPRALGLARRGKNAFLDFGADGRNVNLAHQWDDLRTLHADDRAEALRIIKGSAGNDRNDSVIYRRIKQGRRLRRP